MSNRSAGRYDPGACAGGATEASIVMDYANELRSVLRLKGAAVVRTRVDAHDPAKLSERAAIARRYKGDIMLSIHCNSTPGASGTETVYRGQNNKDLATRLNLAACRALGTRNRGAKTEAQLGRGERFRLSVMAFQPTFLIELGFIDHAGDRAKMLDPDHRRAWALAVADLLV